MCKDIKMIYGNEFYCFYYYYFYIKSKSKIINPSIFDITIRLILISVLNDFLIIGYWAHT